MELTATDSPFAGLRAADGMYVVDLDQRIVHWGPSAERVLGYRAEQMIGRRCFDVLRGMDSRNNRFCRPGCPIVSNARRGRPTRGYDLLCTTADGALKWLSFSTAVSNAPQARREILHLFRDVTHLRSAEEFARRTAGALREIEPAPGDGGPGAPGSRPAAPPVLSPRERQVLHLLAQGMSTRGIARALRVQPVTARNHVSRLLTRVGANSRLQAVIYAAHERLI